MSSFSEVNMAFFLTFFSKHFEIGFDFVWLLRICQHDQDKKSDLEISNPFYKNDNCQCLQRVLPGNHFISESMLTFTQYEITGLKGSSIKDQISVFVIPAPVCNLACPDL